MKTGNSRVKRVGRRVENVGLDKRRRVASGHWRRTFNFLMSRAGMQPGCRLLNTAPASPGTVADAESFTGPPLAWSISDADGRSGAVPGHRTDSRMKGWPNDCLVFKYSPIWKELAPCRSHRIIARGKRSWRVAGARRFFDRGATRPPDDGPAMGECSGQGCHGVGLCATRLAK